MLYDSYRVILENLVLDQLIIIFFAILIICQLDIVLMLKGEILSRSPMGVKGLKLLQPASNLHYCFNPLPLRVTSIQLLPTTSPLNHTLRS